MKDSKKGIGYRMGLHLILPVLYFGTLILAFCLKYL